MLRKTQKQQKIISLFLKGRPTNEIAYKTQSSELYVKRVIKAYKGEKK